MSMEESSCSGSAFPEGRKYLEFTAYDTNQLLSVSTLHRSIELLFIIGKDAEERPSRVAGGEEGQRALVYYCSVSVKHAQSIGNKNEHPLNYCFGVCRGIKNTSQNLFKFKRIG